MDDAGSKFEEALRTAVLANQPEPSKPVETPAPAVAPGQSDGTTPEPEKSAPVVEDEPIVETKPADKADEPPAADDLDPEKVWNKYQTDDDRKKALVESQKTIRDRQDENRKLREQLEAKDKPEPTKDEKPAEVADFKPWLEGIALEKDPAKVQALTPTEREIRGRYREIWEEKTRLDTVEKDLGAMRTKESEVEAEIARLAIKVEGFADVLKDDPEDFTAKEQSKRLEATIEAKRNELRDIQVKSVRAEQRLASEKASHRNNIVQFEQGAAGIHSRVSTQTQQRTEEERFYEQKDNEWKSALSKVIDVEGKGKYTAAERKFIERGLTAALREHLASSDAYPAEFEGWVRKQPVFAELEAVRTDAVASVGKRVDAITPGAPANSSVPSAPRGGKDKTTYTQGLKTAEANLDRMLKGIRA